MPDSPFHSVDLPTEWKFTTLKEILENPPPPDPPWKLRSLMADGCGTEVSAHPHGMKSYTWLQAMIESSLGLPVWGHFDSIGVKNALFLETEDPEWLVSQRVHQVANGMNIKPVDCENCNLVVGNLGPFDLVAYRGHMCRILDKYKPDVAVLSTLQGILGGRAWKEQGEMQDVNAMIVSLVHQYCPITVITHSPWDRKQRRSAGTITQAANYQNILHYEKFGNFVNVKLDSKLCASFHFRIKICTDDKNSTHFEWIAEGGKQTIEDYVAAHPEEATKSIAERFGKTDRYIRKLRNSSGTEIYLSSGKNLKEQKRNKFNKFRVDRYDA